MKVSVLEDVCRFLSPYRKTLALSIGLMFFAAIFEGAGILSILPLLKSWFGTSEDFAGRDLPIWVIGLGIFLAFCAKALFRMAAAWVSGRGVARIARDCRLRFSRGLAEAEWNYFSARPLGRMVNGITSEPDRVATVFSKVSNLGASVFQVLVYVVIALVTSPLLTITGGVAGGLVFLVIHQVNRWHQRFGRQQAEERSRLANWVQSVLAALKGMKAMGVEGTMVRLVDLKTEKLLKLKEREIIVKAAGTNLVEPFFVGFGLIGIGAMIAFTGEMEPDRFIFLAILLQRMMSYLSGLVSGLQGVYAARGILDTWRVGISEIEDARRETVESYGNSGRALTDWDTVELNSVNFSYGETRVLQDMSAKIRRSELTVIKGESGCGKSTTLDLLLNLREPDQGKILVGGVDLKEIDRSDWAGRIGYVPQDPFLLIGTVRDNLTLFAEGFSNEEILSVIRAVGLETVIESLPEGLETEVGERGDRFSGGQRQRMAIARALLRKPDIVFLDEPTSALDPTSTAKFIETVRELKNRIGMVVVTHESVFDDLADSIIQMQRVEVVSED